MGIINILTIDVEDYFQVENFSKVIKFSDWRKYESRVEKNTKKLLDVLSDRNVKATFFILGWIAERFPGLVKFISDAGHEVASHGNTHQLMYSQTPDIFREDIRKSKEILEGVTGKPVYGYRAPCYSITGKSLWALDIIKEENFKYDSSIFPIYHDHGGLPGADRYPYRIGELQEFPISTVEILGQNIPFSGGGYFRLFPYWLVSSCIRRINKEGQPAIIYIHPWELDPEQPRIKAGALGSFRHYVNMDKTEDKLRQLLCDFKFSPIGDNLW